MRATPAMLADLWSLLLSSLIDTLGKPKPSVDDLINARLFLQDNRYMPEFTPDQIKRLDGLYEAYLKGLEAGMTKRKPGASMLKEFRTFWELTSRQKADAAAVQVADRAQAIPSTPFKVQ
jgi:hypothetical protein